MYINVIFEAPPIKPFIISKMVYPVPKLNLQYEQYCHNDNIDRTL